MGRRRWGTNDYGGFVRRLALLSLVFFVAAPSAQGQSAGIDVELFHPNVDGRGFFGTNAASIHAPGEFGVGLVLHYARKQLLVPSGANPGFQVTNRLSGNLILSLGLASWLELGLAVPVSLWNENDVVFAGSQNTAGFGDIRFSPKLRLLNEQRHGVGLSLITMLTLPSGDTSAFLGQKNVRLSPELVLEKGLGPMRLLVNFGAHLRETATYLNVEVGHELFARVALTARVARSVELGAELLSTLGGDRVAGNPLEALFGARFFGGDKWQMWLGAGPGLTRAYGSPAVRVLAGLVYAPHDTSPDRDGDGVPDKDDRCPDQPGPASNQGCPKLERRVDRGRIDTDGDGVPDKDDDCPTEPGPAANRGCPWPDRDKDGVPDREDQCPDVPGPKWNKGCPFVHKPAAPDRDGDGVPDSEDQCPDVAGPKWNKGCPFVYKPPAPTAPARPVSDRDGDGVPDSEDKCPDVPGPKDNGGCPLPPPRVVVTQGEVKILDQVRFQTGKAEILESSNEILDQVATVLKQHPEIEKLEIQGHTDDVGNAMKNRLLSERRALAVMAYLVEKGVGGARLVARGYGSKKPLVKLNKKRMKKPALKAARAKNRRVQFIVLGARSDGAKGDE